VFVISWGNINGIPLVKFGLLIERASAIYLNGRLKALSISFCTNSAS